MDFLKSGLKSVLGAQEASQQLSGPEIVERLVERVQSSTLLDDRRDACRALKALSKKYRVEVGAQGLSALRFILETDSQDCEIVSYALETLVNIMTPTVLEEEEWPDAGQEALTHVGEQFTEMFLKQPENVSLVLGFLEEYDFRVRWSALKLLTLLLKNKLRDMQEIILVSPMGVSKFMDLLSDGREVIRNETLLLLISLTKSNANIQKIVAFENAFDRLFDVIAEEGCTDGGIVVEDCLHLMLNLLKNNTSNQNFFKEGSYIQKLCPMFAIPPDGPEENMWSQQKVANLQKALQVLRCLVSPSNPTQVTSSCQKRLFTSGIFQALTSILMASGVPADFLTDTICTLSEIIRGNHDNQQHFSTIMAPSTPPREAIVILLMSMINEKQPFHLRVSVLYCFQCYLFKNEIGQAQMVQTLISPSTPDSLSCGPLLCSGMFSHDPVSNWLSSVALSHTLIENPSQKEQLIRVLLAPEPNSSPVTLIQQSAVLLQQCSKVQSKIGYLILLATWLSHCHLGVKNFLEVPSAVPYLTAQAGSTERGDDNEELVQGLCAFLLGICVLFNDGSVSTYTKEALVHLINNRIGTDTFHSKLIEVSRHEHYSRASKDPQARADKPADLVLDYEFCKLYKALESMIIKAVNPEKLNGEIESNYLVIEYKDMIRQQDKRIAELQLKCEMLEKEKYQLMANLDHLMKTQASSEGSYIHDANSTIQLVESWRNECNRKDSTIISLEAELRKLQINQNQQQCNNSEVASLHDELSEAKKDTENLLMLLSHLRNKAAGYKTRLKELRVEVSDSSDDEDE